MRKRKEFNYEFKQGEKKTLLELTEITGLSRPTILNMIDRGDIDIANVEKRTRANNTRPKTDINLSFMKEGKLYSKSKLIKQHFFSEYFIKRALKEGLIEERYIDEDRYFIKA